MKNFLRNKLGAVIGSLTAPAPASATIDSRKPEALRLLKLGKEALRKWKLDEATLIIEKAIRYDAEFAEAYQCLADAYWKQRKLIEAGAMAHRATQLDPKDFSAHFTLANVLNEMGKLEEAISSYRRALNIKPDFAEAHYDLGLVYRKQGKLDEAIACYRRALDIKPDFAEVYNNLGRALETHREYDAAMASYRRAVAIKPDYGLGRLNMGLLLLKRCEFEEGWREYEWRWKDGTLQPRDFKQPLWRGENLNGRTILLHGEQGLGDMLQFARYAESAAARGGKVIMETYPTLKRLFRTLPGNPLVVTNDERLPSFDVHLPLTSMPGIMGTNLTNIPVNMPYFRADEADIATHRLPIQRGLRVGLVWSGEPRDAVANTRSMKLTQLVPLLTMNGVDFISLQKGTPAAQIADLPSRLNLHDGMENVADFADTAALIAQLDLFISVDTSVAHLAGAMGKPVWILLRFDSDWRWLLDRDDSPWYPTARLFRQRTPGDWSEIVERVAIALRQFASSRSVAN